MSWKDNVNAISVYTNSIELVSNSIASFLTYILLVCIYHCIHQYNIVTSDCSVVFHNCEILQRLFLYIPRRDAREFLIACLGFSNIHQSDAYKADCFHLHFWLLLKLDISSHSCYPYRLLLWTAYFFLLSIVFSLLICSLHILDINPLLIYSVYLFQAHSHSVKCTYSLY